MHTKTLLVRYTSFAVCATIGNLATQRMVLSIDDGTRAFGLALIAGTTVGLVVKYLLDKRWIFMDEATGLRAHGQRFSRYTAMGIFTTLLFWITESAFWIMWKTDLMREIGAVFGLALGYYLKYHLDKRYVFANASVRSHK